MPDPAMGMTMMQGPVMNPEAGSPTPDGLPRSYWATPWELRWRPWALDFAVDNEGRTSFPLEYMVNPYPYELGPNLAISSITVGPNPTISTNGPHGLGDSRTNAVKIHIETGTMAGVLNSRPWPFTYLSQNQFRIVHDAADTSGLNFTAGSANGVSWEKVFEWRLEDWDPALRFWVFAYDQHLTEWLKTADVSRASIMAAREFGSKYSLWHPEHVDFRNWEWIQEVDLRWWPYSGSSEPVRDVTKLDSAWLAVRGELEQLKFYMEDDRELYTPESEAQADGIHDYFAHFIGADGYDRPWTKELIDTGLAVGSIVYLAYKAHFNRVRPTFLRPGLVAPFGPPEHPAFPSGHAFLAHFIALLLLEIPGVHQRMGIVDGNAFDGKLARKPIWNDLEGIDPMKSALLQIANRIAVNRERIGVHYPSDTSCGRHLAAGIWEALMPQALEPETAPGGPPRQKPVSIPCPSLMRTLELAKSEWVDLTTI